MNKHLLTVVAFGCFLASCATVTKKESTGSDAEHVVDHSARGELIYQVLVAELAGHRGRVDLAMDSYVKASRSSQDPRFAERAARLAVHERAWDEAHEAGRRWAVLEPDNLNAHRLLAGVHLKQGDVQATADAYEKILELTSQPFNAGAASVLTSLAREPDLAVAVKVAQELSTRHPKSAMGHFLVARLAGASEQYEAALLSYDKTLELEPDMGRANLYRAQLLAFLGRPNKAFNSLYQHLERNPDDVLSQLGLARLLIDTGHHKEAGEYTRELYQRYPRRGDVMLDIGLMAMDIERLDTARTYFLRAVELKYKVSDAQYFVGRIEESQGRGVAALASYDQVTDGQYLFDAGIRAAELSAESDSLEVGLGRLSALSGRFASDDAAQRLVLAKSNILQSAGQEEQALAALSQALKDQPSDDLLYARGLAAERTGDFPLFEADMRALVKANSRNAQAMNALGYSLVSRGERLDEAQALIVAAHEIRPDDAAIIDSLGWLYFKQGDFKASAEYLRRAYKSQKNPEIVAHLVEVLWLLGEREEAQKLLKEAFDRAPNNARLRAVQSKLKP